MSFNKENRQAIVSYFHDGFHQSGLSGCLGVEVEHFVVRSSDKRPVYYSADVTKALVSSSNKKLPELFLDDEQEFYVENLLQHLSSFYPEKTFGLEGDLIGLSSQDASITLEPAAQIEISIAPFDSIERIQEVYQEFRIHTDSFLADYGCELYTAGYHPYSKALDLPLIPKKRYQFMNEYFHSIGTHGERMMRASASTQVSIDYRDEQDAVRKMRIAQAISPFIAFMTDNVAMFEGKPASTALTRFAIWRDVDNKRCGSVPGLFEQGFGFEQYADWLLRTSPIFVTRAKTDDPDGPSLRYLPNQTAEEAYSDALVTKADIEHLLSMFWPDVRLKKFVEIRPADSLPEEQVMGYAAFIKGIFYSEDSMKAIEDALGVSSDEWPLNDTSTDSAILSIQTHGAEATIYGRCTYEWVSFLFDLAYKALSKSDAKHLQKLHEWFGKKKENGMMCNENIN